MLRLLACSCVVLLAAGTLRADAPSVEKGTVRFRPASDEKSIPERYRLEPRAFDYQLTFRHDLPGCGVALYDLNFPTALASKHPENNTVYAEYYRPRGKGPFPCVIVLDITAGSQLISRILATHLAQQGVAGLFVQMAYYGPRRPAKSNLKLLSTDFNHTMAAVRQTVLDLRFATAWMASRPEIDADRLGILGTSLGSFMGTLTAEMEPRLKRVGVLLGGGGLVDAYYNHPQAAPYRLVYEALGGTKAQVARLLAPVDPLTCAANLRDRKVLILAGKRDDIVPPKMAEALWRESGKQKIVWFDCTHYGAVVYLLEGLDHIVKHFRAE
jgi:dienelactone hydrolase